MKRGADRDIPAFAGPAPNARGNLAIRQIHERPGARDRDISPVGDEGFRRDATVHHAKRITEYYIDVTRSCRRGSRAVG